MNKKYIIYRCKVCGKTFQLRVKDIKDNEINGMYLSCPFDGRHDTISKIGEIDRYGQIHKCMNQDSYERVEGRIKQR